MQGEAYALLHLFVTSALDGRPATSPPVKERSVATFQSTNKTTLPPSSGKISVLSHCPIFSQKFFFIINAENNYYYWTLCVNWRIRYTIYENQKPTVNRVVLGYDTVQSGTWIPSPRRIPEACLQCRLFGSLEYILTYILR